MRRIHFRYIVRQTASAYVENGGIQGLLEDCHLFAREKVKKYIIYIIYVLVLTVIGTIHVQSLDKFKIESEILKSRPKESGKSCHLNISREFQILIQLSTQIFEQMAKNFKKIGLFMKILIKLYHILVLSMVLDFGRIFEIFETGNSKLGFHVTHFSNKIPSY